VSVCVRTLFNSLALQLHVFVVLGVFVWEDGSIVSYDGWGVGEPNNAGEEVGRTICSQKYVCSLLILQCFSLLSDSDVFVLFHASCFYFNPPHWVISVSSSANIIYIIVDVMIGLTCVLLFRALLSLPLTCFFCVILLVLPPPCFFPPLFTPGLHHDVGVLE